MSSLPVRNDQAKETFQEDCYMISFYAICQDNMQRVIKTADQ